MSKRPAPLFLARETYRERRTMDAARLLPIMGAVLLVFLLPLIRSDTVSGSEALQRANSSGTVLFLFAAWIILIAIAAGLSVRLRRIDEAAMDAQEASAENRSGAE
ncbi:hypothetical protein OU789_08895 [Halocynthiibacter sp. C4]|uniref:hypothetical protein n=1 Tax=Halocynthiibacter sp. C4 TaxID=2992758 RepID=UPI00237A6E1E|nr:hypothetical protein [Halocynthiibacter sp. C4]MDE0590038.1 hypothetical protein [Halocynthiibacter sp. C4]